MESKNEIKVDIYKHAEYEIKSGKWDLMTSRLRAASTFLLMIALFTWTMKISDHVFFEKHHGLANSEVKLYDHVVINCGQYKGQNGWVVQIMKNGQYEMDIDRMEKNLIADKDCLSSLEME